MKHECELLKRTKVNITIEKREGQWLWVFHQDNQKSMAHGIVYCPYCGAKLEE